MAGWICYDGGGGGTVDDETWFMYAQYAGTGLFGTLLCLILVSVITGEDPAPFNENLLILLMFVFGSIGGCLGGYISKKWWGALVGGFFLSGLVLQIVIWVLNSMFN